MNNRQLVRLVGCGVCAVALLAACRDTAAMPGPVAVLPPSPRVSPTDVAVSASPAPEPSDSPSPARSPVPTSPAPAVGETQVDSSLVPETTTETTFAQARINGVDYSNVMWIRGDSAAVQIQLDAGRRQHRFLGSLGVPDDQKSSSSYQVDISLDGGPTTFSTLVAFGQTKDINIDVTGVLRIKITVLYKGDECCGKVAIGNPRFS